MTHVNKEKWDTIPGYCFTTEDGVDIYETSINMLKTHGDQFFSKTGNTISGFIITDKTKFVLKDGSKFYSSIGAANEAI